LGLVIGLFAGLSVSPVVGALLATISATAMAILSLKKGPDKPALQRICGFGIMCAAASAAGIYIRANNLLGMTPARAIKLWSAAGIDESFLRDRVKLFLADQLHQGKSLTEIALSSTEGTQLKGGVQGGDLVNSKEFGGDSKRSISMGIAGMFSLPEGSALHECLDVLDKNPDWPSAKIAYLNIPKTKPSDIEWIDRMNVKDDVKVVILAECLRAALKQAQK
jgi:hypothetical protein